MLGGHLHAVTQWPSEERALESALELVVAGGAGIVFPEEAYKWLSHGFLSPQAVAWDKDRCSSNEAKRNKGTATDRARRMNAETENELLCATCFGALWDLTQEC